MAKNNIVVHKTIIHYLNKETEKLILADYENTTNVDLVKDFKKIMNSVSKNEFTRKGVFTDYKDNEIKKYAEEMIYNEDSFIENSKEIAKNLYDIMQLSENIDSGCLAIGLFTVNDEKQVGIFKIGFKKSYTNEVKKMENNRFRMNMIKKEDLIPENMVTTQSAIILASGINDEYHALVLDKNAEKEKLDSDFIQKFLGISKVEDDAYKTRVIKETIENFIVNSYSENVKEGEDIRSYLTKTLKDETLVTPNEIINKLIEDNAKKEIITEVLEEKIDDLDKTIELDKTWIDKKTKNRGFKTDTGFSIKGKIEDFDDPTKYSLVKNPDGSVNIVLKNIKFFD